MCLGLTLSASPSYPHTEATRVVAESLCHALGSLGHDTTLPARPDCPGRRQVNLYPYLVPHRDTAPGRDRIRWEEDLPVCRSVCNA
jgi:hypothetical protein